MSGIALRAFSDGDAGWLDMWLPSVATVVGYETQSAVALIPRLRKEKNLRARIIAREHEPVGLVVYKLKSPRRGSACFELVATPAEHARNGAGMMAAAHAEEEIFAAGTQELFAPAPAVHGISMYFWIRLGYAPLLRTEWPCMLEGVAWLRRTRRRLDERQLEP